MRDQHSIAVVIPALDERDTIEEVLARIPRWVDRVIVADNGSTDGTGDIATERGAMVVSEPRRGYGRACLKGIAAAGDADIIVFLDADASDSPEQMDRLVDPIIQGRADMVIGSRRLGTAQRGALTIPQRFGNALACALMRIVWGIRYTDLGPFRAVRARTLERLNMDDQTYGWTVQMQVRAARTGERAIEAPVDYDRRKGGRSKVSGTLRGVVMAGVKIIGCILSESMKPSSRHPTPVERIALFAKFPSPGRAKTRLIPALGAVGAADLHAQMVRHMLDQIEELRLAGAVETEVWCDGCEPDAFASAFATDIPCRAQPGGDLGHRMFTAFRSMLHRADAAVIIGSDCPSITPDTIREALDALRDNDLVLGPAVDGGYYLIGLRRPVSALFEGVEWGGADVLRATQQRAALLGLKTRLLQTRRDIDEPEDLDEWTRATALPAPLGGAETPELSIIIPALNEQATIGRTIRAARRPGVEIIVADGGSRDHTVRIAETNGARVVPATRGRGTQLNAGAAAARAPHLLFLHADTILPQSYSDTVAQILADDRVALGAMTLAIDRPCVMLRCVEATVRFRSRFLRTPYGDQALFMRTESFNALGGFAPIPLMEDLDLVRRARRAGAVRIAPDRALTSGRRWASAGVVRMTMINQLCALAFTLGADPRRIAAWRERLSRSKPTQNTGDASCAAAQTHQQTVATAQTAQPVPTD